VKVAQENRGPASVVGNFGAADEPQPVIAGEDRHKEDEACRRENSSSPTGVEILESERSRRFKFPQQHTGYDKSRNDVEDIDTDKPTGETHQFDVEENDRAYGYGP